MKKIITLLLCFISTYVFSQNTPLISSTLTISQVYGGAGCGTAGCSSYKNDYIEIFNKSASTVNLSGYSVQYAAATGTSWQVTSLSNTTLSPGQYFLVAEAFGANGVNSLPTPDVTGTIAMSATAGKVALVNSSTALTGACPSNASIIDFVGYGATANCSETSPVLSLSTTMAAIRTGSGCTDTDNNSLDFTTSTPAPRNSSTTFAPCVVMPVALQDFSVNKKKDGNELHWQVSCLSTSVTFELQRSANAHNFTTFYTSSETKARCASPFTYVDAGALSGANYYRLRIIDIDGVISLSKICLAVNDVRGKNVLRLQPTVVSSQASIQYASPIEEKVEWLITDVQGRIAKKISTLITYGDNKILIRVADLSPGQYQLMGHTSQGNTTVVKFIKQ